MPRQHFAAAMTTLGLTIAALGLAASLATEQSVPPAIASDSARLAPARTAFDIDSTRRPHAFVDSRNLLMSGMLAAALLADGAMTRRGIEEGLIREANPISRPFIDGGWPGMVVGGALVVAADLGIRHALHRGNHHRLERWMPVVLTAFSTFNAIRSADLISTGRRNANMPNSFVRPRR